MKNVLFSLIVVATVLFTGVLVFNSCSDDANNFCGTCVDNTNSSNTTTMCFATLGELTTWMASMSTSYTCTQNTSGNNNNNNSSGQCCDCSGVAGQPAPNLCENDAIVQQALQASGLTWAQYRSALVAAGCNCN